jgi:uncharacterized membrane protein
MNVVLAIHVAAAAVALVAGLVALVAAKGAWLHRRIGMVFVYSMAAMSASAIVIASRKNQTLNVIAGLLTAYLVITGLMTVLPLSTARRRVSIALMLMALALGLTTVLFGFQAIAAGGRRDGIPAFPFFMFGVVGLLGTVGDFRVLRRGALRGRPRLVRHLWRMCWALWIATASFFLGPRARVAKVLPAPLLKTGLLIIPVLAVVVVMVYWLWRVHVRRGGVGSLGTPGAA